MTRKTVSVRNLFTLIAVIIIAIAFFSWYISVKSSNMVDCIADNSSACHGQIISLKRGLCEKVACCKLNNGKWNLYSNLEECKKAELQTPLNPPFKH